MEDAEQFDEAGDAERFEESTLAERSQAIIPGGASTGSKRFQALFGDEAPPDLPSHYLSASGCEVTLTDGSVVTDCTMALGAVSIGYADDNVSRAVMAAIAAGNVSGFSPALEIEVAERLSTVIPIAEKVRFLKTGAEGTAAAVRLARAATGRSHVIGSGYFGWLDWCSVQSGVPEGVQRDFTAIPFDDVAALEKAVATAGSNLAAIIIEPVVDALASEAWTKSARELCDRHGAVLIFDEMKTGFRLRTGGYQELSGIAPDLALFGKALGNGFPICALVGIEGVMEFASKTWISSTLASETSALAAASAMLDWHEKAEVCEQLWSTGVEMRNAVQGAINASRIDGVSIRGIDPMWSIHFEDPYRQSRFTSLALGHGVLFKRGAYNFSSLSHDEDSIQRIEYAASTAFVDLLAEESGSGEVENE